MTYHDDDFRLMIGEAPAFPIPADINDTHFMGMGYGDALEGSSRKPPMGTTEETQRYETGYRLASAYIAAGPS